MRPRARDRGRARLRARLHHRARAVAPSSTSGGGRSVIARSLATRGSSSPQDEFELHTWVPIHIGPLDMSINKAVVYLWIGAARDDPDRRSGPCASGSRFDRAGSQTTGESIYELDPGPDRRGQPALARRSDGGSRTSPRSSSSSGCSTSSASSRCRSRTSTSSRRRRAADVGDLRRDANLSVTLALALITFFATHVEGIRYNGAAALLQELGPGRARRSRSSPDRRRSRSSPSSCG